MPKLDARPEFQQIAKRIRDARKALGLTQVGLAEAAGVTQQSVSQWERGIGVPDASNVRRLAELLKLPPADLLVGDGSPATEQYSPAQMALLQAYVELPEELKPHIRTLIQSLAVVFRKSYHDYVSLQRENNRLRDAEAARTDTR
jgi:transcriptional regulator with XRE-family HTH domain